MRMIKRMTTLAMAAVMTLGCVTMTSYARDPIKSISIEIKSDIEVGQDMNMADIEVEAKSTRYSVGDVAITNEGFEWQEDDTPTVEIRMEALDDNYFSVTANDIKIKGGTYVSGKREDSTHLLLTVKLPSLKEKAGSIETAGWESETIARWSEAYNAGNYEVRLYRDGVNVKMTQVTTTNSLDMGPCMTKAGTYNYKVRSVNKINPENKSAFVESASITVDNELATRMRELYGTLTTGKSEPGENDGTAQNISAGWVQDAKGWWYRNSNGSYTVNDWQQINNQWYYFDSQGYMQTGWIVWKDKWYYCDQAEGHMLTNSLTPDGYRVDSQGVWIQP